MTKASDNPFPKVILNEAATDGSDFSNPAADYRVLFLGEDGELHLKDSSGTVTDVSGAGGDVATDTIWDAKGDLAVGTGADTAAKLTVGTTGHHLVADSGEATGVKWAAIPNLMVGTIPPWLPNTLSQGLAASRAYFYKVYVSEAVAVTTVYFNVGTSAGDIDFGIYSAALSRLGSTGAFASPGTGQRNQALTGTVNLTANTIYYLAFSASSASLRLAGYNGVTSGQVATGGWNMIGRMESAHPLPATITATAWEDFQYTAAFYFK